MGMYTELVFKASIREDVPDDVDAVLDFLFNTSLRPTQVPDHPFFQCDRWQMIGRCSSFSHTPFALSQYADPNRPDAKGGYVFSRSDLKNYDHEVQHFLDWIDPYIDELSGTCIGWTWYEDEDAPTLVFKR